MSNFNSSRFSATDSTGTHRSVDLSDALANEGALISFSYEAKNNYTVDFKAFITAYNETYTANSSVDQVFGRIDPVHMFRQTTRNISLSFVAPAFSASEAYENLFRVDKLRSMLYPTYQDEYSRRTSAHDPGFGRTITQSPLVRIKVINLLTGGVSNAEGAQAKQYVDLFERGQLGNNTPGALCYIKSLNINHNIENADSAVFTGIANDGKATYHNIIPQLIEINLEFTVIHEQFMGHQDGVQAASVYGLSDDYSTAAESYRRSLQRSLGITDADAVRAEASPETQALQDTVDALHAEYMSTSQLRLQIQDLQSAEIVAGSTYGFDSQQALDLRSQLTTLENRLADEIAISTLNRAGTYENLERDGQGWVEGAEPDGSNMVLGSAIGYIPEE